MAADSRRDPTERPPRANTGERLISARIQLDSIAPLPSVPPVEERQSNPNVVLEYMRSLHESDRTVSAALYGDVQEAIASVANLTEEVDKLTAHVIKLDVKVDQLDKNVARLEERTAVISNQQLIQNATSEKLDQKIEKLQVVFEGALGRFDQRVGRVERRMDDIERRFQQFQELVVADIAARREQLNASGPSTPRIPDDPGDPEG